MQSLLLIYDNQIYNKMMTKFMISMMTKFIISMMTKFMMIFSHKFIISMMINIR